MSFPFGPTEALTDERRTALEALADLDRPIRTICGKGVTSANLAVRLDRAGYTDVAAVSGGCVTGTNCTRRPRGPWEGLVVVQFGRRGKGCLSYLVADERVGEAVVIDPGRHLDRYLTVAGERGLAITAVLDTHVHADHISGGRALADRLGVPYRLGAGAGERDAAVEYDPLADGEAVPVGDATLEAMETPGHTSELVSYRLGDHAVFTGDALFVDSLGRTEPSSARPARPTARGWRITRSTSGSVGSRPG
ncbi:MBL fold metallo-hydrolase [Halobaculum litoreum]|uniref:MBL fold metallo-hydrolase n=1 Tax=Halobaculum litoreum TaxID=3031998 RepID=A0ABD5XSE4_9EURY